MSGNATYQASKSPLSQREIVTARFHAANPDVVLGGLGTFRYLVNRLQSNWHSVALRKRRIRFPQLIEFDGVNLVLAGLDKKHGWQVPREILLLL